MTNPEASSRRVAKSFFEVWNANKFAITIAGIGAATFVAGALKGISQAIGDVKIGGGDEPPIRVKGGSATIQLLSNIDYWEEDPPDPHDPDKKHWKIWGVGQRAKNKLHVIIAVASTVQVQNGPLDQDCSLLELVYSDNNKISFQSTGNHITVTSSDNPLERSVDPAFLTYDQNGTGHVSSIWLNHKCVVACPNKGDFHELAILDC